MKLSFLGCGKDPAEIIYATLRFRESAICPFQLWDDIQEGLIPKNSIHRFISERRLELRTKTLQNVFFIFSVEELSSLTANRINSELSRYRGFPVPETCHQPSSGDDQLIMPPGIKNNPGLMKRWSQLRDDIFQFYKSLGKENIEKTERQLILPQGVAVKDIYALNFQSIQRLLDLFMCEKNDWEIKQFAWRLYELMKQEFPSLARKTGVRCWENRNLFCDHDLSDYASCRWREQRPHKSDYPSLWDDRSAQKISAG